MRCSCSRGDVRAGNESESADMKSGLGVISVVRLRSKSRRRILVGGGGSHCVARQVHREEVAGVVVVPSFPRRVLRFEEVAIQVRHAALCSQQQHNYSITQRNLQILVILLWNALDSFNGLAAKQ